MFVSYDNRGFNKAAGGENKTPHMGPDVTLEQHPASVCYTELNTWIIFHASLQLDLFSYFL